ncbi:uncharacterized protein LACBIDRAFT_330568 [Laccaria bicolor S238N-H82]|uniref:Predicted protein n=1 Tax=Laccaria bicolor (strain S238N-H82 / ATCC MYA-4686) TaxID=486041 RepID=B0DLR1_LACBS|nr:uncharacterized protein LACBIDRAFT_330568 [Laccaria bicolor S238N-H82]EDR04436.1 predicted protein [Laccaria bicolor S238N-H82]|eukprot:XP_001884955.1 predicted protein [Laccaria bicolor S238N-H82]
MSMNDDEEDLRFHVQHLLHDYSLAHYTTDYVAFTIDVVAEFLQQLELVPLTDPASLLIPTDPFATLSQMYQLESIPPYDEIPQTTVEAYEYIKRTLKTRPGKPKSERIVEDDDYSLTFDRPMSPILTSKSRRETPTLGKGKAARAALSSYKTIFNKHKLTEIPVEPVPEVTIPLEEALNLSWKLGPEEDAAVLSLLKKTADMNRHQKDYKNPYLDPAQWWDSLALIEPPDPPFIPIFPRGKMPRSGQPVDRSKQDLKDVSDLPLVIISEAKVEVEDDLSVQNMMVVDGWQTISSSPPSTISTPRSSQEEDQLDELWFPSSPDTEPPLVEQVENAKIEVIQMPRSRRIGGMEGLTKHVAAGKTMGSFLLPLISRTSPSNPPPESPPHSPEPATSLIGQPPSALDNANDKEPDANDDLDTELRRLYTTTNPADLIMNEKLDEKNDLLMDGESHINRFTVRFIRSFQVPTLRQPNLHPPNDLVLPTSLPDLAFPVKRPGDSKAKFPHPLKKAKGRQALTVALSWIPFTAEKKLPTIPELIEVDSLFEDGHPISQDVEVCIDRASVTDSDSQDASNKFWDSFVTRGNRYEPPEADFKMELNRTERLRLARIQGNETHAMDVCDDAVDQTRDDCEEEVQDSSDFESFIKRPHKRARLTGPSLAQNYRSGNDTDDALPAPCSPQGKELSQQMFDDKENWPPSSEPLFYPDDSDPSFNQGYDFELGPISPLPVQMDEGPDFGKEQLDNYASYSTSRDPTINDISKPQDLDETITVDGNLELPPPKTALSFKFEPQIATHTLGIASFAQLRARNILDPGPAPEPIAPTSQDVSPELLEVRSAPSDIYDRNTLRLPDVRQPPITAHRYMMSLELLQKQTLVRALRSPACSIDLVERDILNGVDLILDPFTAIIFVPLLSLPSQCESVVQQVSYQSWHYARLLVVFEAYPESSSVRPSKGIVSDLYAYTPPVLKAIKKFRRDVSIAEACGMKSPSLMVQYAFADQVQETALFARLFGDEAERRDQTQGAIWGRREWLDEEISETRQCDVLELYAGRWKVQCWTLLIRYGDFHCACCCVSLKFNTLTVVSNILQWIPMAFAEYTWPMLTPDTIQYGPMNFKSYLHKSDLEAVAHALKIDSTGTVKVLIPHIIAHLDGLPMRARFCGGSFLGMMGNGPNGAH